MLRNILFALIRYKSNGLLSAFAKFETFYLLIFEQTFYQTGAINLVIICLIATHDIVVL